MKKTVYRLCVLPAALLLACTLFVSCANLQGLTDPTGTPTLTVAPSSTVTPGEETDEVKLSDFDPEATYTAPDYSELNPEDYVTLGLYKGLTVEIASADITASETEVEELYESVLQEKDKILHTTDRETRWGDTICFDYVGKLDGEAFSGGSAQNQTVLISEDANYISDFRNGLVGLTPGVPTDVKVVFPENYGVESLNGKETVFTMTVHYIEEKPELTDALTAELSGEADMTVEKYFASLKAQLEADKYNDAAESAIWDAIVENAAVRAYPGGSGALLLQLLLYYV